MAAAFKMPQEPCPLPSLESDEESFVVLGQSIPDASTEIYSEPIGASVIAEAKRLLNSEIEGIEQTTSKSDEKTSSDVNKDDTDKTLTKISNLPNLPSLNKGFESSNAISIVSFTPDMTSEEIQNKVSQIIEENIRLKDTILQNNMSLKSQYERIMAWQEDVKKVHEIHKGKLLEAKNFIDALKREKENLQSQLEKSKQVAYEFNKKNQKMEKLLEDKSSLAKEVLLQMSTDNIEAFKLDVANKKIKDLEKIVETLSDENKRILNESKQEENNAIINNLQELLTNLTLENERLNQEDTKLKAELNDKGQKVKQMEPEFEKIIDERDNALKQVEELKDALYIKKQREEALIMTVNSMKDEMNKLSTQLEDAGTLRSQLNDTQIALTQMEYTRSQAYAQISHLTNELSVIKSQLETLQTQQQTNSHNNQDEVFVLQTQLDVYRADFEEERRAREIIKSENDRLHEDLQNVQRRNEQLQSEIELLRNGDFVVYPSAPQRSGEEPSLPKSILKCPKCNFGFSNVRELEEHVNRCLDLDDNLP
ncbi:NF-kappa-B essential modulator [Diorhabda sublineata]|uniref:NF-kappa-B essential modulator n=1 Tax=Diorhabda sublineata TaxID=1163346 RepID=UPI0024E1730E|nr:NF-kappa-B essential modulator [Diorhabda sublineata]XP_056633019.1 NF-kappa-B essential modulator [Diorhabda sublineata]